MLARSPKGTGYPDAAAKNQSRKLYTPSAPGYSLFDGNGTFSGQATITAPRYAVAFSYQVGSALRAIAWGSVTAVVTRPTAPDTCYYFKSGQSADYHFHWSCRTPYRTNQTLEGNWTIPFKTPAASGTANVTWRHDYYVSK